MKKNLNFGPQKGDNFQPMIVFFQAEFLKSEKKCEKASLYLHNNKIPIVLTLKVF